MEYNQEKYIAVAREEILNPQFAVTKQYLEVNDIEFENGIPKVARVSANYYDNLVAVYFQIKNEDFFIEVHLTKEPEIKVYDVWTESGHRVYLSLKSDDLNFQELSKLLSFEWLEGESKWNFVQGSKFKRKFSVLLYEPIKNLAYSLEEKLELLLAELEKKSDEIKKIPKNVDVNVRVCKYQYISWNAWIHFDIKTINKLNNLNLSIDIDTYIVGNQIKE